MPFSTPTPLGREKQKVNDPPDEVQELNRVDYGPPRPAAQATGYGYEDPVGLLSPRRWAS